MLRYIPNRLLLLVSVLLTVQPLHAQDDSLHEVADYRVIRVGPEREFKSLEDVFDNNSSNLHVLIDSGVYYNNGPCDIRGEDIIVEGVGHVELNCTDQNENVLWILGQRITIRNLHLKHHRPGGENQNCTGRVIALDNCSDVLIENCDINGCGLVGVHDNGGNSNVVLRNNYVHYNSLAPFGDISGNIWMEEVEDHPVFVFENNRVENNGADRVPEVAEEGTLKRADFSKKQAKEYDDFYSKWFKEFWPKLLEEHGISINCDDCHSLGFVVLVQINAVGMATEVWLKRSITGCDIDGYMEDDIYYYIREAVLEEWYLGSELQDVILEVRIAQALRC